MKEKVLLLRPGAFLESKSNHPRACCVPWTLKYIQSILMEQGYPVYFLDMKASGKTLQDVAGLLKEHGPDYIVVQSNTVEFSSCTVLLKYLRPLTKKIIILIGQHITYSKILPREADYFFRGECELAVTDFVKGNFANNADASKMHLVEDLNTLPFPRYRQEELQWYSYPYPVRLNKKVIWGSVLSSRGCPHGCIFCTQVLRESYGKELRRRHPENVINEIKYLMGLGANIISFEDDAFTTSHEHVLSICREFKINKLNIPWICQCRVDESSYDLFREMKSAGCILVKLSIESADPLIIERLKRSNNGRDWVNKAKEACRIARKMGLAISSDFIIGSPQETEESFKMTLNFASELGLDFIQVCKFTPYPGSQAYEELKKEHWDDEQMYHYNDYDFKVHSYYQPDFGKKRKLFYKSVCLRPRFIFKHLAQYGFFYLRNPNIFSQLVNFKNFI